MDGARTTGRLPKSARVRKRSEYRRIQAGARRVILPHFVLLLSAAPPPHDGLARLGITASRKVGNAVVRNRAKRLVREAFRATRALWPQGVELVVIVRHWDKTLRMQDVVTEWLSARHSIIHHCTRLGLTPGRVVELT